MISFFSRRWLVSSILISACAGDNDTNSNAQLDAKAEVNESTDSTGLGTQVDKPKTRTCLTPCTVGQIRCTGRGTYQKCRQSNECTLWDYASCGKNQLCLNNKCVASTPNCDCDQAGSYDCEAKKAARRCDRVSTNCLQWKNIGACDPKCGESCQWVGMKSCSDSLTVAKCEAGSGASGNTWVCTKCPELNECSPSESGDPRCVPF